MFEEPDRVLAILRDDVLRGSDRLADRLEGTTDPRDA
jgi:hypothetical protein